MENIKFGANLPSVNTTEVRRKKYLIIKMSAHHRQKDLTHKEKNTAQSVTESGFQSVITGHKNLPPIRIKNSQR